MEDIITKLINKKRIWLSVKHPFYFEKKDNKILYLTAIFSQIQQAKKENPLANIEFKRLLLSLGLVSDDIIKVMNYMKEKTRIIDNLIKILDTVTKRYIFILDLYNVSMFNSVITKEAEDAIIVFSEIMFISKEDREVLKKFIDYSIKENKEECINIFETFFQKKSDINMIELKYYVQSINYVTSLESKVIKKGEKLIISDECEIKGKIIVPANTTLCIINANINMFGQIVMDGGSLIIKSSDFQNVSDKFDVIIDVKSFSEVEISDSAFYCGHTSGIINQPIGNLKISNCKIYDTNKKSAISFMGKCATIENTVFDDCFTMDKGAGVCVEDGDVSIVNCLFNHCQANKGGAIYTFCPIKIENCMFSDCHARTYGCSIYYYGEIKDTIKNCTFEDTLHIREQVVQYISGKIDFNTKGVCNINYSTIFNRIISNDERDTLNISNANIYMNYETVIKGKLNIKNSRIFTFDISFLGKDIFDISNAKTCTIENSVFDGRNMFGIFRATGTKMIVKNSVFKDTNNGRAIFNSLEPEITDCIFSHCEGGGIYMNAGTVLNSKFVNCRSDKGAGIEAKGMKVLIKNCRFTRCIAYMECGGIKASGIANVLDCKFEECKPNNY